MRGGGGQPQLGLGAALESDNFKPGRHVGALTCLIIRVTPGGSSLQCSLLGLSQIDDISSRMCDPRFCSPRTLGLH